MQKAKSKTQKSFVSIFSSSSSSSSSSSLHIRRDIEKKKKKKKKKKNLRRRKEKKNSRKQTRESMHDFCFTFPYGALVLAGGLLGFLLKRSFPSLLGGGISGSLLLFAGYLSLQAFYKGSNSYLALFLQTGGFFSLSFSFVD